MKNNWTKSGETREYGGICLLGLSKTTTKFRVVSVQIGIRTSITHVRSARC